MPATPNISNLKKDDKNFTVGLSEDKIKEIIDGKIASGGTNPAETGKLRTIQGFLMDPDKDYVDIDVYRKTIKFSNNDKIIIDNKLYVIANTDFTFNSDVLQENELLFLVFVTSVRKVYLMPPENVSLYNDVYVIGIIHVNIDKGEIIYLDFPFDIRVNGDTCPKIAHVNPNVRYINPYGNVDNNRMIPLKFPSQSVAAFKAAKVQGFDYVFMTVGFTSDDVPVLALSDILDGQCKDSTGAALPVTTRLTETTYDIFKTYDFGIGIHESFKGTHALKFDEFI